MWCVHNEIWFMIEEFFQVENWFSEIYRWIYIHSHSFVVFTHTKKIEFSIFFSSVWWCGGGVVLVVVLLWLWCGIFFLDSHCGLLWMAELKSQWLRSDDITFVIFFFVALFHFEHQIDHLCIFLTMSLSVTWTQKWTTRRKNGETKFTYQYSCFFFHSLSRYGNAKEYAILSFKPQKKIRIRK